MNNSSCTSCRVSSAAHALAYPFDLHGIQRILRHARVHLLFCLRELRFHGVLPPCNIGDVELLNAVRQPLMRFIELHNNMGKCQ